MKIYEALLLITGKKILYFNISHFTIECINV